MGALAVRTTWSLKDANFTVLCTRPLLHVTSFLTMQLLGIIWMRYFLLGHHPRAWLPHACSVPFSTPLPSFLTMLALLYFVLAAYAPIFTIAHHVACLMCLTWGLVLKTSVRMLPP